MSTLAYIAACEVESPNAPDFEHVHNFHREKYLRSFAKKLRAQIYDGLNAGEIEDDQFMELIDAVNAISSPD